MQDKMTRKKYNYLVSLAILLIALFMIISSSQAGPKSICDYCKRIISEGEYYSAGDKYFHVEHFLCKDCSKSLVNQKFFEEESDFYCEKCYVKNFTPSCAQCGEPITGKYLKSKSRMYHEKCYNNFIALRCSLCQEIINGEYLIDYWGNKYHLSHKNNDPMCGYCGRYISESVSNGGLIYNDGRQICGICKKGSVDRVDKAEKLMIFITQKLKKYGITIDLRKVELQLVDKTQLARLVPDKSKDYTGLTQFERNLTSGVISDEKFSIYMLAGLPSDNFKATMTHELMHVWLYLNTSIEMDPVLSEGSCNYASYLFFQNNRGKQVAYIFDQMDKDRNKFYGGGYQRVKKMVRRMGIEPWLEYLKNNKNFPSGY